MKLLKYLTVAVISIAAISFGLGAHVSADSTAKCLFAYNPNGFITSATPVFNAICGNVPEGINNEPNFVRIRQNTNGDDEDNLHNAKYIVGGMTAACDTGDKYDIWTYIDNNASEMYNPDKGNGSAVAKDSSLTLSFLDNSPGSTFNFASTISASNAGPVSDSIRLDCATRPVKLSLVPGSVHIYSVPYGNWENLPDSALYAKTPIGSTKNGLSSKGSGLVWGGWTYRMVVVYQVESTIVKPVVKPKIVMPTCKAISLTNNNGSAKVDLSYSAGSSIVSGINLIVSSGSTVLNKSLGLNQLPYYFEMLPNKTYTFKASVISNLGSLTSKECMGTLSYNSHKPSNPSSPTGSSNNNSAPTNSAQSSQLPSARTQLVNTGPGSDILIFIGAATISSAIYLLFSKRRLNRI